jgi:hypothetical protein
MAIIKIGLVKGRHEITDCTEYFFDEVPTDKIFDFNWQKNVIFQKVENFGKNKIQVYATGLTCVLVSVIDVLCQYNYDFSIMHYNRDTNDYIEQYFVG